MSVCLDSYALLAWIKDESGASTVDAFLRRATDEEDFFCYITSINLAEVYYRIWRIIDSNEADRFWQDCQSGIIPVAIIDATRRRVLEAARLKATYPIALGDAFAVQFAKEIESPLLTGDPEIQQMHLQAGIQLVWLAT